MPGEPVTVAEFFTEATGRPLITGMVVADQTCGEMLRLRHHPYYAPFSSDMITKMTGGPMSTDPCEA